MRHLRFYLFVLSLILLSCEKTPVNNPVPLIQQGKGVFIINEGNYGGGNGSVSYYRTDSNKIYNDIFNTVNHRPLGDVCQAMYIYDNKGYIIVNNSQKIEIVDINNFQSTATISGLTSPRCFLPVNAAKAYVSDMYSNSISIINLVSDSKSGVIPCHGSTEEMLILSNKVYLANTEKEYLYIIDPATDRITDSIHLSYGPVSVKSDKNNKLWVMCMGNYRDNTAACLYRIAPESKTIEKSYPFPTYLNVWNKIKMNPGKDTLYFTNGSIFRMSIADSNLPPDPFINSAGRNFYGMGIDPGTGNVYVSDAIDYVQKGKIYIFSANGSLLKSFNAGIIPGEFCFY